MTHYMLFMLTLGMNTNHMCFVLVFFSFSMSGFKTIAASAIEPRMRYILYIKTCKYTYTIHTIVRRYSTNKNAEFSQLVSGLLKIIV